jgi:predicted site-specific integrase-resolvase
MNENNKWIKLSKWAKIHGLTYRTAHRHFRNGLISNETKELPSGGLFVLNETTEQETTTKDCIVYCRVSSPNKKDDLKRQVERCNEFATTNNYNIVKSYKEIASGMNDNRRELNKIFNELSTRNFTLIVENKDRLTRFGFNYIEKYINDMGSKLLIINSNSDDETDLIKDLVSIITSFCCRLYGLRRGAHKARNIKNNCLTQN